MTQTIENTAAQDGGAPERRSRAFAGFGRVRRWQSVGEAIRAHERAYGRSARRARPAALPPAARPRARHARATAAQAPRTAASASSTADGPPGPSAGLVPARRAPREAVRS